MWQRSRLALSFANLVYLRAWADLIPYRSNELFHRKALPGFSLYFGLLGDVLALSLLIFGLLCLAPRLPGWVRRAFPAAALLLMAFAANFLRSHTPDFIPRAAMAGAMGIAVLAGMALSFRYYSKSVQAIKIVVLAATPCVAITFLAPLYYLNAPSPLAPNPPLAARLPGTPPVRVVWVVFDDWDERLTFDDPTVTPEIPALRKLALESFNASHALAVLAGSPVRDMATADAIPSLLYGKRTVRSATTDVETKYVLFAGDPDVTELGTGDNIFARMRSKGWNSGLVGWYLPYCRIFAKQVSDCYWEERYNQASSAGDTPVEAAIDETRMLFETELFSPFGWSLVARRHYEEFDRLMAKATSYAADPALGLTFVHLNVPHEPFAYNPEIGRFNRSGKHDELYIDELKWVDKAVAGIVSAVDRSGLGGKTAIILSSDHPYRAAQTVDPHVPYIVRLPGEREGRYSVNEFTALRSADLVTALTSGDLRSAEEVEKFLLHER